MNSTPENITELQPDDVFCFGSNALGEHYGGAARYAYDHFGAIWGRGEGIQGQSYAIPTLSKAMKPYSISMLERITGTFIYYAKQHPEKTFLLTKVGCGIAGFSEAEIAPLFKYAPRNVVKPERW